MITAIQHNCTRSYRWTIVVLGMGVKCKADVVCSQEPQRERGDVGISHLADEIRQSKGVWTAIGKGTGLVVDERTDVSRGANDDIIVTDLRSKGEKITRIVNIYDQRDTPSGERLARNLTWQ
jgi:hypothetical protein